MRFESDAFFYELKKAYDAQDKEEMAALLYPHIEKTSHYLFGKHYNKYANYTEEDRRDAIQEAALLVMNSVHKYLENPRNHPQCPADTQYSPQQKRSYFFRLIEWGLQSIKKPEPPIEPIDPFTEHSEDDHLSLIDKLASPVGNPEEVFLKRNLLNRALKAFFDLPSKPDILVSVGFIILHSAFSPARKTMDNYADFLNGKKVIAIIALMERLLMRYHLDTGVLHPLKKALATSNPKKTFEDITKGKLANRKNRIINLFQENNNSHFQDDLDDT